jgi:SAM-dependent methyltransferase
MSSCRKEHWDNVYRAKSCEEVSWYQPVPAMSLKLITDADLSADEPIIDIGGGASTLVDQLLDAGFKDVTVLDISGYAIEQARSRLGTRSEQVHWEIRDVREFAPTRGYRLWHDRAMLHFLLDADDCARYVDALRRALVPGGYLVLATFGPDGPLKCSGLEIRRYDVQRLSELLGPGFELEYEAIENHETPQSREQQFLFSRWRRQ